MKTTLALVSVAFLAACTSASVAPPSPAAAPSSTAAAPAASRHKSPSPAPRPSSPSPSASGYPALWVLPNQALSPGAAQPGYTIKDICPHVNPALEAMRPSSADKARVYAAYGITSRTPNEYEIDHIIPVELLGLVSASASDPVLNLYPELNDKPDLAMERKYHLPPSYIHNSKDILEDVLHADVCSGAVPLATAQQAIASDWRAAYVKYVGPPPGV